MSHLGPVRLLRVHCTQSSWTSLHVPQWGGTGGSQNQNGNEFKIKFVTRRRSEKLELISWRDKQINMYSCKNIPGNTDKASASQRKRRLRRQSFRGPWLLGWQRQCYVGCTSLTVTVESNQRQVQIVLEQPFKEQAMHAHTFWREQTTWSYSNLQHNRMNVNFWTKSKKKFQDL